MRFRWKVDDVKLQARWTKWSFLCAYVQTLFFCLTLASDDLFDAFSARIVYVSVRIFRYTSLYGIRERLASQIRRPSNIIILRVLFIQPIAEAQAGRPTILIPPQPVK